MKHFTEAEKLASRFEAMPSTVSFGILKGVFNALAAEVGRTRAATLLAKSFTVDIALGRPKWKQEMFSFDNEADRAKYAETFKEFRGFINLFERLKKGHGEKFAQEMSAKLAVPASVPYLARTFKPIDDFEDIGQLRQLVADYLGDGAGFTWTEQVSDDRTEVRYRFIQCAYIEVLRAYGLTAAAASVCYCDHIIFDNAMPQVYFRRDHCKGVGDDFCDHLFRIRTPDDDAEDSLRYGDTERANFDAKGLLDRWAKNFRDHGGSFKW